MVALNSMLQALLHLLWAGGGPLTAVWSAWSSILAWLITRGPSCMQDVILSVPRLQDNVIAAFCPRYREVVRPLAPDPSVSFASLDYHVDPAARQTLQFAALAALSAHLQSQEVLAPSQLLPQVSRVLLTTEEPQANKYLEAVATALASQMNAGLLVVNVMMLATLCSITFGRSPEAYLAAISGGSSSSSSAASGMDSKLRLAWRVLREALYSLERPTVVFVRNAEALLCSSQEAHEAFMDVFGRQDVLSLKGAASRAPLVLLGGVCVNESAAARAGVRSQRQLQPGLAAGGPSSGGEEEDAEDSQRPKAGRGGMSGLDGDDELGLADLLRSLSQLAGESQRPNPRKLLMKVFPTRIKLLPPPAGPAALKHQQRLQRDVAEEAEEEDYRAAAAVAASTGVAIPPKASGIYGISSGMKPLSRAEWGKVLSWAVAIETLQAKQLQLQQEQEEEATEKEQHAALRQVSQVMATAAGEQAGDDGSGGSPPLDIAATQGGTGLRQRRVQAGEVAAGAVPSGGRRTRSAPGMLPNSLALATSLWRAVNPLRLAAVAATLPWRLFRAAGSAVGSVASSMLCRLPLVGGLLEELLEERLDASQLEAELQELEAQLAELEQRAATDGAACVCGSGRHGGGTEDVDGGEQATGKLRLSEAAVRYGLGMLQRSSLGVKQSIEPANSYERQLLGEVLSPEDCGRGFSEVGALAEAKMALREAVQLPLKHPELFAGGTLARPSKGVLLFGPPGTGKTLVARAAAAECGAAFLALNPSAVASKWFGDSVKFIRAAFTLASKLSPCVIFIDEVDALLGRRNSLKEHEALREMKNEMMSQWDGIRPGVGAARVMVLGATNRPFDIDEAVLRRFTHRIFVGLPDKAARAAILGVVLEGEKLAADVDIAKLAECTQGYSGSDLKQLCVQAAMRPVRSFLEQDSSRAAAEAAAEQEASSAAEGTTGEAKAATEPQHVASGDGSGAASSAAASADHSRSARLANSSGMEQASAAAAPGASAPAKVLLPQASSTGGSSAGESAVVASLRLVPRLNSLLRQAESIARLPTNPKTVLRPISMQDFEEAVKQVGASVDPDSSTIQELNDWNKQWGSLANREGVRSKRLSYFT